MPELSENGTGPRAAAATTHAGDGPTAVIPATMAARIESQLTHQSAAATYVPTLPIYSSRSVDWLNYEFFQDIEAMRKDAPVRTPLRWILGAVAQAEWEIEASDMRVAEFNAKQLQWWWANARGRVHEDGATFGWSAGETTYDVQDDLLVQLKFDTFHPQDADPLVRDDKPCGIRIRNSKDGHKDLWAFRDDVPNKGFWYTHQSRHGMRRGQSQLRPAWRPWRRLMGRDGAEDLIDLGVMRNAIGDTVVGHPNKVIKTTEGNAPPYAVNGSWHTRDEARWIAENRKGGAGIAIASEYDAKGNPLWYIESLKAEINIAGMIDYVQYLKQLCSEAIGVPPELFQAAETGSGYSGRAIPLQGFLVDQQRPLDDLTRAWVEQTGLPLSKWNFGPDVWVRITPVPLIESYKKHAWEGPQSQAAPGAVPPPPQAAPPPPDAGPVTMSTAAESNGPVKIRASSWSTKMEVVSAQPTIAAPITLATDTTDFINWLATASTAELESVSIEADIPLLVDE